MKLCSGCPRNPRSAESLERLPLSRRVVRRFVAGETPAHALDVLERLEAQGLQTAVTYLGENVTTPRAAAAAADVYGHLIEEARRRRLGVTPSLKLTHLGLDLGEDVALANVERVLERAGETWVWIDMEGSAYTERTLAIYRRLRRRWRNVACVLQAYLHRTEADLRGLVPGGLRCASARAPTTSPRTGRFPRKADVDRNYARLAGMLLLEGGAGRRRLRGVRHPRRAPDPGHRRPGARVRARARPLRVPDAPRNPAGAPPDARRPRACGSACSCPSGRTGTATSSGASPSARPTFASSSRTSPGADRQERRQPARRRVMIPRLTGPTAPPYHSTAYG